MNTPMGLAKFLLDQASNSCGISTGRVVFWHNNGGIGQTFKLGLYWVEVVSFSPKSRNVRYRRITARGKPPAPVESMGKKRFAREATPA